MDSQTTPPEGQQRQLRDRPVMESKGRSVQSARPLYLMPPGGCVVDLDGPALAVRRRRQPEARYPLTRLSRIVSGAAVDWKAKALLACLENRIPIVLLDGRGTVAGYTQPVNAARSSLHALLNELLDRSDWSKHYENWRRAERMRAVRAWLQSRQDAGKPVDPRGQAEVVRRYVYYTAQPPSAGTAAIHQGALLALTCEKAHQAGLASAYSGVDGTVLHLTVDLCALLGIVLELELLGLGAVLETAPRETLRIFETYSMGLEERCRNVLGRLHRRLSELLREWH